MELKYIVNVIILVINTIRRTLKQNDTKSTLYFNVKNERDGSIISLINCSAKFQMKEFNGTALKVNGVMNINDPPNGQCGYQFSNDDLDTPGAYNAEIEITYSDSKVLKTNDRLIIIVVPEVAAE